MALLEKRERRRPLSALSPCVTDWLYRQAPPPQGEQGLGTQLLSIWPSNIDHLLLTFSQEKSKSFPSIWPSAVPVPHRSGQMTGKGSCFSVTVTYRAINLLGRDILNQRGWGTLVHVIKLFPTKFFNQHYHISPNPLHPHRDYTRSPRNHIYNLFFWPPHLSCMTLSELIFWILSFLFYQTRIIIVLTS